jgi:NAD(P)-dependent dehydrogenase (short-subunit alcohol dehydrogenase family)
LLLDVSTQSQVSVLMNGYINVKIVFPTDMTSAMTTSGYDPAKLIPEKRAGEETDIAGVALFLASKAGSYLNGNVLVCDGGRLSIVPSTY